MSALLHDTDVAPRRPIRDLSTRATGVLFALALGHALAAQVNLQLTFRQVGHPMALGAANLEPSAAVVRGWYRLLMEQGTYLQMIRTEVVDLWWALALAGALVMLMHFVAACLRRRSPRVSQVLSRWALLGALPGVADIVENCFSLAMLTDPWGFPDALAPLHAAFSYLKLAVIAATAGGQITLTILGAVRGPAALGGSAR